MNHNVENHCPTISRHHFVAELITQYNFKEKCRAELKSTNRSVQSHQVFEIIALEILKYNMQLILFPLFLGGIFPKSTNQLDARQMSDFIAEFIHPLCYRVDSSELVSPVTYRTSNQLDFPNGNLD